MQYIFFTNQCVNKFDEWWQSHLMSQMIALHLSMAWLVKPRSISECSTIGSDKMCDANTKTTPQKWQQQMANIIPGCKGNWGMLSVYMELQFWSTWIVWLHTYRSVHIRIANLNNIDRFWLLQISILQTLIIYTTKQNKNLMLVLKILMQSNFSSSTSAVYFTSPKCQNQHKSHLKADFMGANCVVSQIQSVF